MVTAPAAPFPSISTRQLLNWKQQKSQSRKTIYMTFFLQTPDTLMTTSVAVSRIMQASNGFLARCKHQQPPVVMKNKSIIPPIISLIALLAASTTAMAQGSLPSRNSRASQPSNEVVLKILVQPEANANTRADRPARQRQQPEAKLRADKGVAQFEGRRRPASRVQRSEFTQCHECRMHARKAHRAHRYTLPSERSSPDVQKRPAARRSMLAPQSMERRGQATDNARPMRSKRNDTVLNAKADSNRRTGARMEQRKRRLDDTSQFSENRP